MLFNAVIVFIAMKKIFLVFACLVVYSLLPNSARAQNVQNFTIESFNTHYVLNKDPNNMSQMTVDEYIKVRFPDYDQNHGILRALPKINNRFNLNLKILAVDKKSSPNANNTEDWHYSSYTQNNNLVLKIGDANLYVHGTQYYHIKYQLSNVINQYGEFYWNVNGTQWQQTINQASATVSLDANIADKLTNKICYTGKYSSKEHACSITQDNNPDKTITVNSARPLQAGENISFALAFAPGTFNVHQNTFYEQYKAIILFIVYAVSVPLLTLIAIFAIWLKRGRDPRGRGTIIAQYEPPRTTSLLINDFILNEKTRPIAVSAQIIELAVRGYIRIIDNPQKGLFGDKKDFILEALKTPGSELSSEELSVLIMFFTNGMVVGEKVDLKDLNFKLSSKLSLLNKTLSDMTTKMGFFRANPNNMVNKYILLVMIFGILAVTIAFIVGTIGLAVGLIIGTLIALIATRYMPAKTILGVELHDYMLGLKLYIGMAEQERIRFHQSPDNAERKRINTSDTKQMVKLFESLLPYAMLFGMEKDWGKQFEKLYVQPPGWYSGNWTTFNTALLASSLGSFNSVSSASFSAPQGGGSGFGGGGSGGGGGGGGGGGW